MRMIITLFALLNTPTELANAAVESLLEMQFWQDNSESPSFLSPNRIMVSPISNASPARLSPKKRHASPFKMVTLPTPSTSFAKSETSAKGSGGLVRKPTPYPFDQLARPWTPASSTRSSSRSSCVAEPPTPARLLDIVNETLLAQCRPQIEQTSPCSTPPSPSCSSSLSWLAGTDENTNDLLDSPDSQSPTPSPPLPPPPPPPTPTSDADHDKAPNSLNDVTGTVVEFVRTTLEDTRQMSDLLNNVVRNITTLVERFDAAHQHVSIYSG